MLPPPRQDRVESYRAHVNPYRVEGFEALGWTEELVEARGSFLVDASGRRFLDMSGCFGAVALGHHSRDLDAALSALLASGRPCTMPFGIPADVGALAGRLCALAGADLQKVYFGNSGAEGIEAAMKLAMIRTGRAAFISFEGSYHGLTLGALGLMGGGPWRGPLEHAPRLGRLAPFGDLAAVERLLEEGGVAAVVVEVVQGVGGARAWSGDALDALERLCRRHGALLILDEVLTGLGRTGAWFAFQGVAPGLRPDIVVTSKGLTGGVIPLSAVLMTDDVFHAAYGPKGHVNIHGSTFSANAMAVAAGLCTLDVIAREGLVERAAVLGERLASGLRRLQDEEIAVCDVRGRGLLLGVGIAGVEQPDDALGALAFCQALRERGVIVTVAAHAPSYLKLTPPLTISEAEVDLFLDRLREVMLELVEVDDAEER
ncbi:aspartate aminotransferase family protein [Sorangium sp. So ce315]|uniref:class-III pyridoxal-phosphate-dependent aminotransferase n=1 Tax=Sorangium sp. So ce315 TaxID=3133299 RepID=UPI003F5F4C48